MNKVKLLYNGLTPEQQEVMDEAYEALMSEVKVIDLTLYEKFVEESIYDQFEMPTDYIINTRCYAENGENR